MAGSEDGHRDADAKVERAVAERRRELWRRGLCAWLATVVLGAFVGMALSTIRWGGAILVAGCVASAVAGTWLFIAYVRSVAEVDD